MSMINEVRESVLAIVNKNNYGYISPSDFNLFAQQAQLDIFEDYFYAYNNQLVKENIRRSGSGYADLTKGLSEVIDSFSEEAFLTRVLISNNYNLPDDYYLINKVFHYSSLLTSGTNTLNLVNKLVDNTQSFTSSLVPIGSIVVNIDSKSQAFVTAIDSATTLSVSTDLNLAAGKPYQIFSSKNIREVERVTQNKIFYLNNSNLTAPTNSFPAYVLGGATSTTLGNTITIYPVTINGAADIKVQYIRYPRTPQWTYVTLANGEPVFDQSSGTYVDFELPVSDEYGLVNKILEYAGISIREEAVYNFGKTSDDSETQQES